MAIAGVQNGLRRAGLLDLDGGVVDSEPLAGKFIDFREHQITAELFIGNDNMTAHRKHARGQRPDMQIMDRFDAADAFEVVLKDTILT